MSIYKHNKIVFILRFLYLYNEMEYNNYEQMTVSSLKNLARERGKTRYSRLNKSELIKKTQRTNTT